MQIILNVSDAFIKKHFSSENIDLKKSGPNGIMDLIMKSCISSILNNPSCKVIEVNCDPTENRVTAAAQERAVSTAVMSYIVTQQGNGEENAEKGTK